MTYEECFETKEFIEFYRKELDVLFKQRKAFLDAGKRYHCDVYAQIGKLGLFPREKITAEFFLINEKKSQLSSNQRAFVADVVMRCVFQTLQVFEKQTNQAINNL